MPSRTASNLSNFKLSTLVHPAKGNILYSQQVLYSFYCIIVTAIQPYSALFPHPPWIFLPSSNSAHSHFRRPPWQETETERSKSPPTFRASSTRVRFLRLFEVLLQVNRLLPIRPKKLLTLVSLFFLRSRSEEKRGTRRKDLWQGPTLEHPCQRSQGPPRFSRQPRWSHEAVRTTPR